MANLIWVGTFNDSGIGRASSDYVRLLKKDFHVRVVPMTDHLPIDIKHLVQTEIDPDNFSIIVHGSPTEWDDIPFINNLLSKAKRKFKLFAWETNPLYTPLVEWHKSRYDGLIVPSPFCKYAIRNWSDVHIIPHHLYHQNLSQKMFISSNQTDKLNVLFMFSQDTHRKGFDLLRPLLELLDYDMVTPYIKCSSEINRYNLSMYLSKYHKNTGITLLPCFLKDDEIRKIYHDVDIVCSLSRGEGFGYSFHEPPLYNTLSMGPDYYPYSELGYCWTDQYKYEYIRYDCEPVKVNSQTYIQYGINIPVDNCFWIQPNIYSIANILNMGKKYHLTDKDNSRFSTYNSSHPNTHIILTKFKEILK